jgi:cysteine-rich repeat protein
VTAARHDVTIADSRVGSKAKNHTYSAIARLIRGRVISRFDCDDGNREDGDGCSAQCLLEPALEDFSRFAKFAFSRESALGFCAPVGAPFDFAVATNGGSTTVHWSVLRDGVGCESFPFSCPDRDDFMRILTADEVSRLRETFRAVELFEQRPNGCDAIAFDPCLVNSFRWDEFAATDSPCETPLIPATEVVRILDVLADLTN